MNTPQTLLTLSDAHLAFGHVALLDGARFSLHAAERVGLIGRNGAGKSSLLKILGGLEKPDDGTLHIAQNCRVCYVAQEPALEPTHTVFEAASQGLSHLISLHREYESATGARLDAIHHEIDALDGWAWRTRVEEILQRLGLDGAARIADLSGGTKKRVALAQALIARPDVLLLDEPTNHLDLQSIEWLEDLLRGFSGAIVTITHDRAFLDATSTRIVELDRGQLRSFAGNFAQYQEQKQQLLHAEAQQNARADKLLAQEEVWIRQGVEARRTRSRQRVARLHELRAERAARREVTGSVRMRVDSGADTLGYRARIVAALDNVHHHFEPARPIVRGLSTTILRGDKVALMGTNGAGKTTLLKLILGELEPTAGRIERGANLHIAYFDQMRAQLDLDATLEDFISPGSEWIEIGRERRHVRSYLADFLFSPARAHSPVRSLSGGERNRLLLARLFARPANVLVLDEPTNDLDIDTLELLEELLANYDGTVFLVSHDRAFVDNVATTILAAESDAQGPGLWREYTGGVQDWRTQSARLQQHQATNAPKSPQTPSSPKADLDRGCPPVPTASAAATSASTKPRKLSYKEQRELEALPEQIAALEAEQAAIRAELADPAIYARDNARALALHSRDAEIEEALMHALERWDTLGSL